MTAASATLPAEDRLLTLDVVRGAALLGIFVMNVPGFGHSMFASPELSALNEGSLDRVATLLREWLFAGKFNLLFSLLFGIGFTLQLTRLQAGAPGRAVAVYVRRLLALLAIGVLHAAVFWAGDVLVLYAVMGFVLLLLRRAPEPVLIALVVATALYATAAQALRPHVILVDAEAMAAFDYQELEASNNLAFGHGSFADAVRETQRVLAWGLTTPLGHWSYGLFYAHMASGMLLGCIVARRGWVQQLPQHVSKLPSLQRLMLVLAVAGIAFEAFGPFPPDETPISLWATAAGTGGDLALMGFYALTLARCAQRPQRHRWTLALATAGRMPLSNYLLQTAMGLAIFYGWGGGLWGRLGAAQEMALAVALFVGVQLPLSSAWLRRYRYGPLEYLWRAVTYARWPPLRRP